MTREKINGRRLVGLFLLGMVLLNYPFLCLFNRPVLVMGIPLLYLYLFGVWSLIVILMLFLNLSGPDRSSPNHRK